MKAEIRQIISQLKNGSITIRDIPEEYKDNKDIIKAERKLGLRKIYRCGYDVISDKFFVEEELTIGNDNDRKTLNHMWFDDFAQYSDYLEGNIYKNACYYQLDTQKLPDGIDNERLQRHSSFIEIFKGRTITDVWLFKHDGPESLEMATTNEVAQSAWLDKGQIKELFDNGEFVDTLGYFFEEKELGGE